MAELKLSSFLDLAHVIGAHPDRLVAWSEGSCACRVGAGRFLVSRRGSSLERLSEADVVQMDQAAACELFKAEQLPEEGLASALVGGFGADPSTDALLYAHLFEMDGVDMAAHVQPVEVNQICSSPRARQFADRRTLASEVVACGGSTVLVPYTDPGLPLAREVKKKIMLWRDRHKLVPRLLLLQNHGMIVMGGSLNELVQTAEMTLKAAKVFAGSAVLGGPMFLSPNNVAWIEQLGSL